MFTLLQEARLCLGSLAERTCWLVDCGCCYGDGAAQVVDALSRHFLSFESDSRVMPLIWHISLLVFVQRYKHQLTSADRDALQHLTTVQNHYKVRTSPSCPAAQLV